MSYTVEFEAEAIDAAFVVTGKGDVAIALVFDRTTPMYCNSFQNIAKTISRFGKS